MAAGIRTNIRELQGRHHGEMIYVIASGASMDFFYPPMFANLVTIGVNQVHRKFPCTYVVSHHPQGCQEIIDKGLTLVVSEFDCGQYKWGRNDFEGDYYYYKHADSQQCAAIDLAAMDTDDSLAISASTTAEAVHFAAHLGASTIVLCGADHGRVDGKINFEDYNNSFDGSNGTTEPAHLPMTEPLLQKMVNEVRRRGRNVVSLSPFMNLGMEGHKYSRPPAGSVYMPIPEKQRPVR